jgi:hypothetical protein
MSSDPQPVAQQVSTTSNAPWSGQQPFLTEGWDRAKTDVLNTPGEFYPNDTVVPMHGATTQALGLQEQRALSGSPVTQAAQGQVQQTAQGDYLNAGNPYMTQAIQGITQPMTEQFQEDIIPGIQSGFSGAGRYGSGLQARQQERAGTAAMNEIGKVGTNMGLQIYGDERGRQLQAASLAPQMAQQDYTDIQALKGVGQEYEAQAGADLQGDINRFNFEQNAPKSALAQYMALVSGGGYSDQTTNTPIYRNQAADLLGGAAQGASIAGSLFGKGGVWGK